MKNQQEWEILSDQIVDELWEIVYQRFSFEPDCFAKDSRYTLKEPYDLYSCAGVFAIADSDPNWRETIQDIFCTCLKDQKYMYVLDWHHTCYKYYPQVKTCKDKPTFIEGEKSFHGGYYAYFPEFYPDGDYYLFFSKDLSWGYLTDPWRKEIFVYGELLRKEIQKKARYLGFILIETSEKSKKDI
ncbi:DUF2716 domain-containing protein [Candidatus Enterococcus ferrettii]|uniref:DUF2716 domain-containing protein n=1 Tax=Candidatus Enterococcus ferrettii TaxID=2815324 RepID=A0ABV0EPJ1_9ENTE|nr:DUF2716 domain-containing protein [Enterococcus sp. 665A]MBO1338879.1 DUF2716 domain-containing protein [Enterococcus sp. 665A]